MSMIVLNHRTCELASARDTEREIAVMRLAIASRIMVKLRVKANRSAPKICRRSPLEDHVFYQQLDVAVVADAPFGF